MQSGPPSLLTKGQVIRCSNTESTVMGEVMLASEKSPQSVLVRLMQTAGIRRGGGVILTNTLPLTVDYEAETVTDLFGNEWEIDVAGTGSESNSVV